MEPGTFAGRPCAEALGDRWYLYEGAYLRAIAGEYSSFEVDDLDGGRRYLVEVSPLSSSGGEVTGGVGLAREVGALRRVEGGVRSSQDHEPVAFEASPVAMARVSMTGELLEVNQAFVDLLGHQRERLLQMSYRDFTHPDDLRADLEAGAELQAGTRRAYETKKRYLRADGEVVWVQLALVRIDGGECPAHLFVQVIDVTDREQATAQLQLQALIAERLGGGVVLVRASDARIVFTNTAFTRMLGYDEGELDGEHIAVVNAPGERTSEEVAAEIINALDRYGTWTGEVENRTKDGGSIWCRGTVSSLQHPHHGLVWISIHSDVTEAKRGREALREAEQRFEQAFENAPIGMAPRDLDGRWVRVNRAVCEITGYEESELLERTFQDITHPDDLEADLQYVRQLVAGEIRDYRMEKRYITAHGQTVWINLAVSLVRDTADRPLYFITQIEDISDRKRLEERLRELADHDPLTAVRNRRVFDEALMIQVGRCHRYHEMAALLMIDMDGFKEINDTYGHKIGDRVLKAAAAALVERVRATDLVARIGGDEFAVLLPHTSPDKATIVAGDIQRAIRQLALTDGTDEIRVDATIGIATIDQHTKSDEAVLADADRAMYAAKALRVNTARYSNTLAPH